jgi:hypothetical protein
MRHHPDKPLCPIAKAGFVGLAVVLASFLLHGCTFARVRYLDGAEAATELDCKVEVNTFVCRPLYKGLRQDGVQLAPLNNQPRVEM